jgi:hypothetical protein
MIEEVVERVEMINTLADICIAMEVLYGWSRFQY